jgi:hypothetical protein
VRMSERTVSMAGLVLSPEQSQPRSPGIHVSSVIRHMSKAIGRQKENDFTEQDLDMFASVGRIFEVQLATAMCPPPRYERVGEIECDGIIGSPDAIDTVDWSVQEYKANFASANHPIESRIEYFWQMKAYCHMLGMCRASLFVFYVGGTWRPPIPVFKAWDILFSPSELEENWQMILTNAKELR